MAVGSNNGTIHIQNPYTKEIKIELEERTSVVSYLILLTNGNLTNETNKGHYCIGSRGRIAHIAIKHIFLKIHLI
jgi:hypothetical protein